MPKLEYISPDSIVKAYNSICRYINKTPLLKSKTLNNTLQCDIYFKFEGMQKGGSFKVRGALNTLLYLKEQNILPKEIITYSSGNHAQAVAWAAKQFGITATIIIPAFASKVKIAATRGYGANVILTQERQEAEDLVHEKSKTAFLLPPCDHDDVVAGQGTAALEAWMEENNYDAVFAPYGGGGLVSGTYLGKQFFSEKALVFACEPEIANDASQSYKTGVIKRFEKTPMTIADGAQTLGISE